MWKALVLLVAIGILVWLGYIEDQNTTIDSATSTQLESSSEELSSESLSKSTQATESVSAALSSASDQVDNATQAAVETLNDAVVASSEVADSVIDELKQSTDTATASLKTSVESTADVKESAVAIADVTESAVATAAEQAAQPMSLSSLSRKIGGAIGTTTSLLAGVSDEASAKAVLPKLASVMEGLSEVALSVPGIPDAAKAPLAKLISSGIDRIKPLADKSLSNRGVGDILQPVLGPMMETLEGLTQ
jgi:hypothetical protein